MFGKWAKKDRFDVIAAVGVLLGYGGILPYDGREAFRDETPYFDAGVIAEFGTTEEDGETKQLGYPPAGEKHHSAIEDDGSSHEELKKRGYMVADRIFVSGTHDVILSVGGVDWKSATTTVYFSTKVI